MLTDVGGAYRAKRKGRTENTRLRQGQIFTEQTTGAAGGTRTRMRRRGALTVANPQGKEKEHKYKY